MPNVSCDHAKLMKYFSCADLSPRNNTVQNACPAHHLTRQRTIKSSKCQMECFKVEWGGGKSSWASKCTRRSDLPANCFQVSEELKIDRIVLTFPYLASGLDSLWHESQLTGLADGCSSARHTASAECALRRSGDTHWTCLKRKSERMVHVRSKTLFLL